MTDSDRFLPHATVATVLENDGKFLLVEELSQGRRVLNQPAGHLEPMESLIEAAARETLEETCWHTEIRLIWASRSSMALTVSAI